jgi:hypothetical protein
MQSGPPFDATHDDLRDPLRDHIASLERLLELLLAKRGRTLTAEEVVGMQNSYQQLARASTILLTLPDTDGQPVELE